MYTSASYCSRIGNVGLLTRPLIPIQVRTKLLSNKTDAGAPVLWIQPKPSGVWLLIWRSFKSGLFRSFAMDLFLSSKLANYDFIREHLFVSEDICLRWPDHRVSRQWLAVVTCGSFWEHFLAFIPRKLWLVTMYLSRWNREQETLRQLVLNILGCVTYWRLGG